jgi:hypothetical protein
VAHEALIRGWDRLRTWVEADRAGLRTHRRLTEAAHEWENAGRDPSFLYAGVRLAVANEWAEAHPGELSTLEADFLVASREAERKKAADELETARRLTEEAKARHRAETERAREAEQRAQDQAASAVRLRRRAWFLGALSLAAVLSAVVAVIAWREARNQATIAEKQSRITRTSQLASMAAVEQARRYDLALLLSVAALQLRDSTDDAFEARHTLFTTLNARPGLITFLHHDAGITAVAFSPDGKTLAAGYQGGVSGGGVVLFDVAGRRRLGEPLAVQAFVRALAFSPDGKTLAAGYQVGDGVSGGGVVLFDVAGRRRLGEPLAVQAFVEALAFSPDGKTLAAGYQGKGVVSGGGVVLFDVAGRRRLGEPLAVEASLRAVAFSPDGKTLAAGYQGGGGGGVVLYDVAGRRRLGEPLAVTEGFVTGRGLQPRRQDPGRGLPRRRRRGGGVVLYDVAGRRRLGEPLAVTEGSVSGRGLQPRRQDPGRGLPSGVDVGGGVVLFDVAGRRRLGEPLAVTEGSSRPWPSAPTARPWPRLPNDVGVSAAGWCCTTSPGGAGWASRWR